MREPAKIREPASILVVDDDPTYLQLLTRHLGSSECHVLLAEDGDTAIARAVSEHPDLILMDVPLPGMSGFDTCRAIRARPATASIPVIFLTALNATEEEERGFQLGAAD